ncbi:MAG: septum formation initiator family protein [Alphaproteobacteria bacterium]|nr:septum formation initiator family protein [Alphaproteobacteria bacterium]
MTVYFSYHVAYGVRSYTQLQTLQAEVVSREQKLFEVRSDREMLESRVRMMRPGSLSRDLLEERARTILGYKSADEFLLLGN